MKKKYIKYDYDLIVIGSGAGGSIAADIAASQGKRVAMVENDRMGGSAANWGCVPSKAMLEAAKALERSKNASNFGIRGGIGGFNYPSVLAWKDKAIRRTGAENSTSYYRSRGIGLYHGQAHFISPHEITINRRHLSSEFFLIATGSNWRTIDVTLPKTITPLYAGDALELKRPPKHLFIIGGGATGVEFAELFATFGSKVYIAELAPRLLPKEDQEVSQLVEAVLAKRRGVQVLTKTKVTHIEKDSLQTRLTFLRGGSQNSVRVDHILIAAGKQPSTDIGLENAGVEYDKAGIHVNEHLQTNVKHIYAVGDVIGQHMSTHTAMYESRIAAHNMFNKQQISPEYHAVPRVTFLTPEVASVGMSEEQCLKRDMTIKTSIVPISIIARANTSDAMDGFIKIITDKKGVLIGATVVSQNAGEVIHELTLAIHHRMSVSQVASTLHAFPTWSEAVRVACEKIKL